MDELYTFLSARLKEINSLIGKENSRPGNKDLDDLRSLDEAREFNSNLIKTLYGNK